MQIQKGDKVGIVGSDKEGVVTRCSVNGTYLVRFSKDCVERFLRTELELIEKG